MKTIVFDTGPIISLAMNNLLGLLEPMKKKAEARFLITDQVRRELVDNPLNNTKRFMFEAMQVLRLIEKGILEVVAAPSEKTEQLLSIANNAFQASGHPLRLVHEAEMSALALVLQEKADAYVVDERTTRMFVESPHKLLSILRHNFHMKIEHSNAKLKEFQKVTESVKIIRSVELVTVAYEIGLLDDYLTKIPGAKKRLLESVIWGVKLEGCAVSKKELEQIMKIEGKRQ